MDLELPDLKLSPVLVELKTDSNGYPILSNRFEGYGYRNDIVEPTVIHIDKGNQNQSKWIINVTQDGNFIANSLHTIYINYISIKKEKKSYLMTVYYKCNDLKYASYITSGIPQFDIFDCKFGTNIPYRMANYIPNGIVMVNLRELHHHCVDFIYNEKIKHYNSKCFVDINKTLLLN